MGGNTWLSYQKAAPVWSATAREGHQPKPEAFARRMLDATTARASFRASSWDSPPSRTFREQMLRLVRS
ncbi:hypothetical protein AKJ09_01924 [Labilithrix luteola]|uniref:Uncharacterized protein n=1 Tax=Labilithrix luteola TaxID=1391654 RepID=A0A0K1PNZ9_9BACT|nr:hypothetical protein AKJ09_01924 [Labilithrix luteola]